MAGIDSSYSETSGYLTSKEWGYFHELLTPARNVCEKMASQHGMRLFKDSRWPATGLESKSGIKHRYIRLTLNPSYLEDKQIFFELREHKVLSVKTLFNKTLSNNVIQSFTSEQMLNEDLLTQSIMLLLSSS